MAKIDRLGWAAGMCFRSYGLRIGIRTNSTAPAVLDRVRSILPPGWEPAEPPIVDMLYSLRIGGTSGHVRNYHLLYAPLHRAARTMDADVLFDTLENEIQLFVGEYARERTFLHAGVVGWKGRALVLPGRTLAGKSTLVAALLRAGADYYSDEYAVFDAQGRVHPYARRLSLRQPTGRAHRPTAEELGSRAATEPLPVAAVVLTHYRPGAPWRPRPLSAGQTLLEMLHHTLPVVDRPQDCLATLQHVVPRSANLKGPRGAADEAAGALLRFLDN